VHAEDAYAKKRADAARRSKEASDRGRDIGELPKVVNRRRRTAAGKSLSYFCQKYLPETFYLVWSPDHRRVIKKIERAVMKGGTFAVAMPRGFGKTSLCEAACLWALLYGYRRFLCLIGADEDAAIEMLESIRAELESNALLAEDFPEVCYPIACLEGINHRCRGQTYRGERTRISWKGKQIILPTIAGSAASAAILKVRGITGRIRGMHYKRPDGRNARPDLVILDDPQTDESADNPAQCRKRAKIIKGTVLGLAGPGRKIAAVMPCTVIREGDVADAFLSRDNNPQWQGERGKLIYHFPKRMDLWDKYLEIRAEDFRTGGDGSKATTYYRKNRKKMNAGARVAWPQRFDEGQLSGLQYAMDLRSDLIIDGDASAFDAEYQNQPIEDKPGPDTLLFTPEWFLTRTNNLARNECPEFVHTVTAHFDVHKQLIYWAVCGWGDGFRGVLLDYGTAPDQPDSYFAMYSARRPLSGMFPNKTEEELVFLGLQLATESVMKRKWKRDDGAELQIDLGLVDTKYQSETVGLLCRGSEYSARLLPAAGQYVGPESTPFSEYKRKAGDQIGHHWRIPNVRGKKVIRHILVDTNFWKTALHSRMGVDYPGKGSFSLFGFHRRMATGRTVPADHTLLADHAFAEKATLMSAKNRTAFVWKQKPGQDNHHLDNLVGCFVAASKQGISLLGEDKPASKPKEEPISLLELRNKYR